MKVHLGYFLAFSAIALAICAGFFSVYGLSHMFAGAAISVIVMASTLELSKLIIATYLHSYWNKMSKLIRVYLTTGVVVLAIITSLGIYGYLSNAYQITANKVELFDGDIGVLDSKIKQYESKIASNDKILESKNNRIEQLMGIRDKQESRLDASNTKANRLSASNTSSDINALNKEIDELNNISASYNDSIAKLNTIILEKKSKNDVAGEVGTLKYMAEITGMPMSKIVNIFILLIVFVFDPLAICLVIATNNVFNIKRKEVEESNNNNIVDIIKEEKSDEESSSNVVDFKDTQDLLDETVDVIEQKEVKTENVEPKQELNQSNNIENFVLENTTITDENDNTIEEAEEEIIEEKQVEPTPLVITPSKPQTVVEKPIVPIKYENIKEVRDREKNKVDRGFSKSVATRNTGGRIERI